MVPIGTPAPDFKLPDPDGREWSLQDFPNAQGLLVVFLCNHCPFVKHLRYELADFAREYEGRGLAIVGINSNDSQAQPDDSPDKMREEVASVGYTFPYLVDESQEVAKAYGAACTPDFFLYDRVHTLVYRGQFDDSRPSTDTPVTGGDLRAAADALLEGGSVPETQVPSIGCNIKWKAGNSPDWFGV